VTDRSPKHAADGLTELTALIAASFVSNNTVAIGELQRLIVLIHGTLLGLQSNTPAPESERLPAVPPDESVTRDFIVCLEDGQRVKMLKRYLRRKYALTPDQYRARWKLPDDYPMVAPAYAELRSSIAKRRAGTA
jgi:predicted transcriptional regulator